MNEDQLSMYSAYMSTLGNREDLFPGSGYVDKYIENPPDDYTVNAEYLTDEKFATLIAEAEKYLHAAMPWIWRKMNPAYSALAYLSWVTTEPPLALSASLGGL